MIRAIALILAAAVLQPAAAGEPDRALEALRERYYCRILDYLQAIWRYPMPTEDRYLIADALPSRIYVQCILAPDRTEIYCEAASGRWRRPVEHLVPDNRLPQLTALGFDPDPGDGNYHQKHELAGAADLARFADLYLRSFYLLYGIGIDSEIYLHAPLVPVAPTPRYLVGAGCYPLTS